ncbi:hypothetical protein F4778DRAFT_731977 [Xylariomycetidae sp. FL2044]|nr:hypothetical protein F4778DRAFT_731977 [Xylariomycetidae sp. FL2044]
MAPGNPGTHRCAPFRFSHLPPELRLKVLENTDLVAPTRRYIWITKTKYWLPHGMEPGSWEAPGPLFLVSKAFYRQAQEVFFRNNHLEVWPDTLPFWGATEHNGQPGMKATYAASEFLSEALPATSLPHLRSLQFPRFTMSNGFIPKKVPQDDWFRTMEKVRDKGLNLRYVSIDGVWEDAPDWKDWQEVIKNQRLDGLLLLRRIVKESFWPLLDPKGPPLFVKQLWVEIGGGWDSAFRYCIRKEGECVNIPEDRWVDWGDLFASRPISWSGQDGEDSAESIAQQGEWVEEVWAKYTDRS